MAVGSDAANGAPNSFTREPQHQAYYPRDGVLIVDNLLQLEGSCYLLFYVHQGRTPASASIRNLGNEGVLCLSYRPANTPYLTRGPQYNALFTAHVVAIPLTPCSTLERRRAPALGLVPPSSRISAQASRIYALAAWCMKEVVSAVRLDTSLHYSVPAIVP
jgi:hypothetical protein